MNKMENCDQSKVFVGGILWETTEDLLKEHFGKYGKVIDAVIAKDRTTGTSRGFAFVSFSETSALDKALLDTHRILGRTVEVKKAVRRSEHIQNQQQSNKNNKTNGVISDNNTKINKIFVGGLPPSITEDEFRVYFEKFGEITDAVVMHDNATKKPRGFGFVTFESEKSTEEVLQKNFHEVCGKLVEVKRAVPKEDGGNGIGNYYSGWNGIGNYLDYRGYDVVPVYGGYPYGYYGGVSYGFSPWGPFYHSYMGIGYGFMGGNGYVTNGKPSQLSNRYVANGKPSQLSNGM